MTTPNPCDEGETIQGNIEEMQQNLHKLDEVIAEINTLKSKYTGAINNHKKHKKKEINALSSNITKTFSKINNIAEKTKTTIVKSHQLELNKYYENLQLKFDVLQNVEFTINNHRSHQQQLLKLVKELCVNKNIKDYHQKIDNISAHKSSASQQTIDSALSTFNSLKSLSNDQMMTHELIINDKYYGKILKYIPKCCKLKYNDNSGATPYIANMSDCKQDDHVDVKLFNNTANNLSQKIIDLGKKYEKAQHDKEQNERLVIKLQNKTNMYINEINKLKKLKNESTAQLGELQNCLNTQNLYIQKRSKYIAELERKNAELRINNKVLEHMNNVKIVNPHNKTNQYCKQSNYDMSMKAINQNGM